MRKKKPKIKIEFMPGCFDDFEGTQEELEEMIREIEEMAADGTLFDNSEDLTEDELDEIWASLNNNLRQ